MFNTTIIITSTSKVNYRTKNIKFNMIEQFYDYQLYYVKKIIFYIVTSD